MATEYKLSYTAEEINESLDKINSLEVTDGIIGENNLPASGVTAGTYGGYEAINGDRGVYNIPVVNVDEYGRVTEVINQEIGLAKPERYLDPGLVTGQMLTQIKTIAKKGISISTSVWQNAYFDDLTANDVKRAISNKVYCPRILNVLVYVAIDSKGDMGWCNPEWYGVVLGPTFSNVYVKLPSFVEEYNPVGNTFDIQVIYETGLTESDGSISQM